MSEGANCPSCGAPAPPLLRHAKLAVCAYCHSTLFVEDAQVKHAGEKSVLAEIPSILVTGRRFEYGNWMFEPVGRIRYEYGGGAGQWDEWWVLIADGRTAWISNDEGEYVIESEVAVPGVAPDYDELEIGGKVALLNETLTCTERDEATCLGVEGQLPLVVAAGDGHRYAHLEGPRGMLVTAEYSEAGPEFFKGVWVDPFAIKAL